MALAGGRRLSVLQPASSPPYDVTVAMPTRDGGPIFERALQAVLGQETNKRVELLALDSGSRDGTLELLRAHHVRVLEAVPSGFNWGAARERMFQEARGGIVVNLSQDAVPARADWLERLTAPMEARDVAVSCGSSIPDPQRGFPQFQWEKNGYYYFTQEIRKFVRRYGRGVSFANTAVRRSVWEAYRIQPQATGEDFQFQQTLHGSPWRVVFPDDAPVLHHHNYTTRAVWRRCRNEGLALRGMGCSYHEGDLIRDLASLPKYRQWLREAVRGGLTTPAEWLYPVLRPLAVYSGSRFARRYIWY